MADPTPEPSPMDTILRDPGRSIRCWIALFLRLGVGLSLLTSGLAGYFSQQGRPFGGGGVWGQGLLTTGIEPFFAAIPYLAIGIGLALILGFLTTASAIASAFFSLLTPILMIIQIVGAGASGGGNMGGRWGNDPFSAMMASMVMISLIPQAALIWFSPLENHPYSIDALIFGRNEIDMAPRLSSPLPGGTFEPEPEPEAVVHIGE
jgi:hypothetical protein